MQFFGVKHENLNLIENHHFIYDANCQSKSFEMIILESSKWNFKASRKFLNFTELENCTNDSMQVSRASLVLKLLLS